MKKMILFLATLGLISTAIADPYQKCAGCHGAKGKKVALGKSKVISDMTKQEIVDSLKGYKDGTYGRGMKNLMVAQVKGISEADINDIASKIGK